MKCPHCLESFHEDKESESLGQDVDYVWSLEKDKCPQCKKFIFLLNGRVESITGAVTRYNIMIYPKAISRTLISNDVPYVFSQDYKEACMVIADSPKASAALSRRCLQNILREKTKVKKSNLSNEITKVLESKELPSYLSEPIDAIRNIGNFAAHPTKSTNTGEVVDVEPGEAEWLLDVLEGLFDFYFVQPETLKRKRDALNKKLAEIGKPEMKNSN